MTDEDVPAVRIWDEVTGYRTCTSCNSDCEPEPLGGERSGIRIAFVCPKHGVHSVVDPFEGRR